MKGRSVSEYAYLAVSAGGKSRRESGRKSEERKAESGDRTRIERIPPIDTDRQEGGIVLRYSRSGGFMQFFGRSISREAATVNSPGRQVGGSNWYPE
jgi:hypothetical protein